MLLLINENEPIPIVHNRIVDESLALSKQQHPVIIRTIIYWLFQTKDKLNIIINLQNENHITQS